MSIKQAIEALEELVEYAETAGFDWSLDNARAALAALRSMQGDAVPVEQGNTHEEEPRIGQGDPHSQEDGGHDASGTCAQGRAGEVQRDQHRAGDADAERENDQRTGRGDGVRGACDVSSPIPYGQVTVVKRPGCQDQHWFYRWPEPPYLDNAAECVIVYATPHAEAVDRSEKIPLLIPSNPGELTEAVRMSVAWQPIETAPKHRTLLLGYFNSHGNWRTLRGQWFSQESIEETWEDADLAGEGWYETPVEIDDTPNCFWTEPTHWMPFPPAPTKGTE